MKGSSWKREKSRRFFCLYSLQRRSLSVNAPDQRASKSLGVEHLFHFMVRCSHTDIRLPSCFCQLIRSQGLIIIFRPNLVEPRLWIEETKELDVFETEISWNLKGLVAIAIATAVRKKSLAVAAPAIWFSETPPRRERALDRCSGIETPPPCSGYLIYCCYVFWIFRLPESES